MGSIPLDKLTQNDLQQFYTNLKQSGRRKDSDRYGEGLSDQTVRGCHKLYKKYGEAIEADCSDEEFMALFEKFPDFDRYDDAFVEGEEEFTSCVAHYVDEHIENFATIVE